MALVDTQGFVMAVDRSLFGPQGRRWIERKLPEVACNISFVAVSAFGACLLVYHICMEFSSLGYRAILQAPKYLVNAVIMHLVARGLRWHVDRMLGGSFMQGHEMPDFFAGSRGRQDGGTDRVLWPWQSAHNKDRTVSVDSTESDGDDEQDETKNSPLGDSGTSPMDSNRHRRTRSAESVNANPATTSQTRGNGQRSIAVTAASVMMDATSTGMRMVMGETERVRMNSDHGNHNNTDNKNSENDGNETKDNNDSDNDHMNNERARHENAGGQKRRRGGGSGGRVFPDLFAACRPHDNHSHSPTSKALPSTESDRVCRPRRASFSATSPDPGRSSGATWDRERAGSDKDRDGSSSPASRVLTVGRGGRGSMQGKHSGSVSDDGASGGNGAGSRGSLRRLQELTRTATATGEEGAPRSEGDGQNQGGNGSGNDDGSEEMEKERVADLPKRRSSKGGGTWRSIDTISRAFNVGSSRRRTEHGGDRNRGSENQKLNFFTEADQDELLHSTFFIKMCDDASWLYVEDHPYHPEWNWLLSLWGGYKIAPRFRGEVKQNEAHRMLFQCEKGRHSGHVRIRSHATNTFLFFLGVKQPHTWVAWDRDVVGGDWEDLKLEWVGKPADGLLVGDERGRLVIHSRSMNGYVSWDGSRFAHVPSKEGAAVFVFQRMASSSRTRGSRRTGHTRG